MILAATLLAAGCTSSSAVDGSTLMTQTATAGTWRAVGDSYELGLSGVSPVTVLFTDRPQRSARSVATAEFVDDWSRLFGDDPPNAAVQLTSPGEEQQTAIVTLRRPRYQAATGELTYTAEPIADTPDGPLASLASTSRSLPDTFDAVSVFIDGTSATVPSTTVPPSSSTTTTTTTPTKPCTTPGQPQGTPLTMSIVNNSAFPDDQVYVALTGVTAQGFDGWDSNPRDLINTSVPLACLPADPSVPGGHAYQFQLGEGIGSGLLWVSLGSPVTSGLPATQPSFDTAQYRFANVEFAYPGQGDMTNVDQFSFPVDLDTYAAYPPAGAAVESSHYNADTCTIVGAVKSAVDGQTENGAAWSQVVVNDDDGDFVRVVSPKQRAKQLAKVNGQPNPYAQGWPDLSPYLATMKKKVIVKGLFTPGAGSDYYDQSGWYSYEATFDASGNVELRGSIAAPLAKGPDGPGRQKGEVMTIAANGTDTNSDGTVVGNDDLLTGLYDQSSRYTVGGVPRNGLTNGVAELAAPDDVYNAVYRDFVTAFTYGYWGGKYGTSNEKFWGTFAPPAAPSGGQPAFAAARTSSDPAGLLPYNLWSQTMFQYSNNYNIPYGEDYGSGSPDRPSPLLDVPVGGTWRVTIQPDGPSGCLDAIG